MKPTQPPPAAPLNLARTLLEKGAPRRAVALLARQALEEALDTYWKSKNLPFNPRQGRKQQLICLREYLRPTPLATQLHQTWATLSRASHHHIYELPPTVGELQAAFEVVQEFGGRG
jgi:hypothetical protein